MIGILWLLLFLQLCFRPWPFVVVCLVVLGPLELEHKNGTLCILIIIRKFRFWQRILEEKFQHERNKPHLWNQKSKYIYKAIREKSNETGDPNRDIDSVYTLASKSIVRFVRE